MCVEAVAAVKTLLQVFHLGWEVKWEGCNMKKKRQVLCQNYIFSYGKFLFWQRKPKLFQQNLIPISETN